MPIAYAIDYGTSNSLLAAASNDGAIAPIPLDLTSPDSTVLRSILYAPAREQWLFGNQAIESYGHLMAEGRLLRSIKKYLPESSFEGTVIHGVRYKLHDLIAIFLAEMRNRANLHFNDDVTSVVLGRPAAFSLDPDKDKLAESRLKAAALQAGFKQVEFCPEPIAAAYEFRHTLTKPQTVLIADFGGGTSDFTVLKMSNGPFNRDDVMSVGGVPVAGDMFDGAIMRDIISPQFGANVEYKKPMGSVVMRLPKHLINRMCNPADISFLARDDIKTLLKGAQRFSMNKEDSVRMNRLFMVIEEHLGYKLFSAIEGVKKELSYAATVKFNFKHYELDVEENVSNKQFEEASRSQVDRITQSLDQTIQDAGISNDKIDIVCCTGGTAKIAALHAELAKRFGEHKLKQHKHFHSVIGGLAERAFELFS